MAATTESVKKDEEFHDIMKENFMDFDLTYDDNLSWIERNESSKGAGEKSDK